MWELAFAVDHVTPQWMSWTAVVVMLVTPSANMLTSWFAASEMFPFRDDQSGLASSLGTVLYEWQLWRPPTTTEHNSYSAGLLSPALSRSLCEWKFTRSLCVWKFTTTVAVMIFSRTLCRLDRQQELWCLSNVCAGPSRPGHQTPGTNRHPRTWVPRTKSSEDTSSGLLPWSPFLFFLLPSCTVCFLEVWLSHFLHCSFPSCYRNLWCVSARIYISILLGKDIWVVSIF